MLELKINKLDIEYIKLWSEYMVTRDSREIMDRLKSLAMKGQLNAVAWWYSFNKKGDCKEIDDIATSLKGENYAELWAMGRCEFTTKETQEKLTSLQKKHVEICETIDEIHDKHDHVGPYGAYFKADTSKEEYQRDLIANDIEKVPAIKHMIAAAEETLDLATRIQNPYLLERASEMLYKVLPLLPHYYQKTSKICNARAFKNLLKQYKKMKRTEEGRQANANIQFYYHFAKSILTSRNKPLTPLAINILKEICDYDKLQREAIE